VTLRHLREEGGDGVASELGAVESGGGKAAEGLGNFFGSDGAELPRGFSEHEFGELGAAGDGSDAAAGFEAGFGDAAVIKARGELENVAAGGIGDLDGGGGVGEITGVARGFEVVEDGGGVHRGKYGKCGAGMQLRMARATRSGDARMNRQTLRGRR
jgi:hypothetical protein